MKWLKKKWDITDNWQFWTIMLVFAITGSSSAKITNPILKAISLINELPKWGYIIVYICCTVVIYQILLVSIGWLFGEFNYFWNFEKKMLSRFRRKKQ